MRILVIEDDLLMQQTLKGLFSEHQCTVVGSFFEAEVMLQQWTYAAVFIDIQCASSDPKNESLLLKKIKQHDPSLPCIFISGNLDSKVITHYWNKIVKEESQGRGFDKKQTLGDFGLKGDSHATRKLRERVLSLCMMPGPFLILGETGVGKELVARALWSSMGEHHRPFIPVNCASLPENLVESELFGYEKGAFTGAMQTRAGLFEAAHGGDIFLDEIGDLDLGLQAKLLRVLQEKKIRRLGSEKERSINFRIIAATNRDLAEAVFKKEFREDIFFRLNVYSLKIPPLRERKEDIPILIDHFLNEMGFSNIYLNSNILNILYQYSWPGNVRQVKTLCLYLLPYLKHKLDEKLIEDWIDDQGTFRSECEVSLGGGVEEQVDTAMKNHTSLDIVHLVSDYQKNYVSTALKLTKNNRSQAAKVLGVSRQRLSNWLSEWGIY